MAATDKPEGFVRATPLTPLPPFPPNKFGH
jgi:hypothetical protein